MEIICPDCKFSREVDETKIPARSQVATCPKCQVKFKFRELPDESSAVESPTQETPAEPTSQYTLPLTPSSPAADDAEPIFPKITAPGEDHRDGLWDKLDDMTPPEAIQKPKDNTHEAQRPIQDDVKIPDIQEPVPGWNGEFNDSFPDPMQGGTDSEDADDEANPLVPPPFEQLDRYGFFHGLYMTIKLVLRSPRLFFAVMPVGGGLAKPLTFTILLTMIQGFIQYFWSMAGVSSSVAPEGAEALSGVSNALAPVMMLLFMPAFIAAGQFIITGIYHVLLILMRADNKGFEGTFRALAYANAPIIVGIFPMPIKEIEVAWMGIAAIWVLFLTIIGLKYIHRTSYTKVIPVALIPLLLGMIAAMAMLQGAGPSI